MHKRGNVLVTGVTGQDGSFLAEKLLSMGYDVIGTRRPSTTLSSEHINLKSAHQLAMSLNRQLSIVELDLSCASDVISLIAATQPLKIFNMAAQSHVGLSFSRPEYTLEITGVGAIRLFEACMMHGHKHCKIYQASTSEMFGGTSGAPLNSTVAFNPKSPYAAAKVLAHNCAQLYRNRGLFVSCGILFNHESERRGLNFVTRKVTHAFAAIKLKKQTTFKLGSLWPRRDWGYANDYVDVMIASLDADTPHDFVVGTGVSRSIKDLVITAGAVIGMNAEEALSCVETDSALIRPLEVENLIADTKEADAYYSWRATVSFEAMIEKMIRNDLMILSS
jgi:GDPmannose 4,6-dehydratase